MTDRKDENTQISTQSLAELFRVAHDDVVPGARLLDAIAVDAVRVQAQAVEPTQPVAPRRGWVNFLSVFGGWQGATGLVACGVFGLLVGLSAPETLNTLVENLLALDGLSSIDSTAFSLDEILLES